MQVIANAMYFDNNTIGETCNTSTFLSFRRWLVPTLLVPLFNYFYMLVVLDYIFQTKKKNLFAYIHILPTINL